MNGLTYFTGQRKSKVEQKGKPVETDKELSFQQRRKQDALELAQLVYDMFKECQLNDSSDNKSEDVHE